MRCAGEQRTLVADAAAADPHFSEYHGKRGDLVVPLLHLERQPVGPVPTNHHVAGFELYKFMTNVSLVPVEWLRCL